MKSAYLEIGAVRQYLHTRTGNTLWLLACIGPVEARFSGSDSHDIRSIRTPRSGNCDLNFPNQTVPVPLPGTIAQTPGSVPFHDLCFDVNEVLPDPALHDADDVEMRLRRVAQQNVESPLDYFLLPKRWV